MHLCFIGDSFVAGVGDDTCLGWVGRACAEVRNAGVDITAYNLGVRGNTSADILARWQVEVKNRLPEDAKAGLIFSFGTNDCCDNGYGHPKVNSQQALENTKKILTEALKYGPCLMLGPLPVLDDQTIFDRVDLLSKEQEKLCMEIGVPYLPIFEWAMSSETWQQETLAGDGAHPNQRGYSLLADYITQWQPWQALCE